MAGTLHEFDPEGTAIALDQRTYSWSDGCAGCGGSRNKTSRTNHLYPGGPLVHNYYYDQANRMVRTIVTDQVLADPPAYDPANPNGYARDTLYDLDGVPQPRGRQ